MLTNAQKSDYISKNGDNSTKKVRFGRVLFSIKVSPIVTILQNSDRSVIEKCQRILKSQFKSKRDIATENDPIL